MNRHSLRLVEYFAIIGVDPDLDAQATPTPLSQTIQILDRYPRADYTDSSIPSALPLFCQPDGAQTSRQSQPPTLHSFTLTDTLGHQMYGVSLTFSVPATPGHHRRQSFCVLSRFAFIRSLGAVLKQLYRISQSPRRTPMERYIVSLCRETPAPIPGALAVELCFGHGAIEFALPSAFELPLLDVSVRRLFRCLSLDRVLWLFRVLCAEKRKVVLSSAHRGLSASVCHALLSLLRPFRWQLPCVPLLPRSAVAMLDAPVPLMVGVRSAHIPSDVDRAQLVIVELDRGTVSAPSDVELIAAPKRIWKELRRDLKRCANAHKVARFDESSLRSADHAFPVRMADEGDDADESEPFDAMAVRASFYKFWIRAMGERCSAFFAQCAQSTAGAAQRATFVSLRPRATRAFWRAFAATQSFCSFADELSPSRKSAIRESSAFVHSKGQSHTKDARAFARFLVLFAHLKRYRVPPPNTASLGAECAFDGLSAFSRLSDKYLIAPRAIHLLDATATATPTVTAMQGRDKNREPLPMQRMCEKWFAAHSKACSLKEEQLLSVFCNMAC